MNITKLTLNNWMRYRGAVAIPLTKTVYGLTARFDGDARRSNWGGKTALIEAVRFALYGTHRMNREDDWITRGEQSGGVTLTLSNGLEIVRSRARGSSTKLSATHEGNAMYGDAAQAMIERIVGLSCDDFEATCWFGQKQLNRLIVARPTERFDLVSGWFDLDPLQRCEANAKNKAQVAAKEIATIQEEVLRRDGEWRSILVKWWPDSVYPSDADVVAHMKQRAKALDEERAECEVALQSARAAIEALEPAREAIAARTRLAAVIAEGKGVAAKIADLQAAASGAPVAQSAYDQARADAALKATALREVRTLVRQGFDGKCPVVGFECPAAAKVQSAVRENTSRFEDAQDAYDTACRAEAVARRTHEEHAQALSTIRSLETTRNRLRDEGRALKAVAEHVPDGDFQQLLRERNEALEARLAEQRDIDWNQKAIKSAIERAEQIAGEVDGLRERLRAATARLAMYRAAARIFGRQGAQRAIAEAALREIEQGANAILTEAGIDLGIKIEWAREGSGLASHCADCGASFGSSAKVKKCPACNADRGPKLVERLEIELSDRSGAAEDLAGASLQMSAARWLRRARDVQWSTALIDEPFGALDEAHRRSFAAQLNAMLLGRSGFEQAIIIAHHPDVTDGLPGKLVVAASEQGSTVLT